MKLIRSTDAAKRQMVLLAPSNSAIPKHLNNVKVDAASHNRLLAGMQKLRGRVYLEDGAIEPWQLDRQQRHKLTTDHASWHVLSLDETGTVVGCSRYLAHSNTISFAGLQVSRSALASCSTWSRKLVSAVHEDVALAARRDISYVELGGWALDSKVRGTTEALKIALGTYALGKVLGGCIGITTATFRNCSSSILRRIGGRSLMAGGVELPPYYDPEYKCSMEILRFDADQPNPNYTPWIDQLCEHFNSVKVLCARPEEAWDSEAEMLGSAQSFGVAALAAAV